MKKRIFALVAAAIMVVSSTVTALADTTTGLIGQYNFDGDLKNEVTGELATVYGKLVSVEATTETPEYANGVSDQAIALTGLISSYGLKLDVVPTSNTFTLSYDVYYREYSQYSPVLFLGNSWDGVTDTWASFGCGWQASLAFAAGIWIHDLENKTPVEWVDVWTTGGNADLLLDENAAWVKWHNITYVVTDAVPQIYIDGVAITAGSGQAGIDFINETTQLYLGINAWDSPLNAAVDNVLIYDRALTADDVAEIVASRDYDAATAPEIKLPETTFNKPQKADPNNADYLVDAETLAEDNANANADDKDGGISTTVIVIGVAVVVVIVVVVVIAVVAAKKKNNDDDDEE